MSIPNNQDIYAYVVPGGQITLTVMFQTFLNSGIEQPVSGVQLPITPLGGGSPVVSNPTLTEIDQATYQYQWLPPQTTAAGDYVATWTSTSPASTITQVVTVVPLPSQTPNPGLYASLAQYRQREYDLLTPDDLVNYHLQLASGVIDEALIGAVYPTDADGMPTNPEHIAIFMRACCAQVAFQLVNNDPQNVKTQFSFATAESPPAPDGARQKAQGRRLPHGGRDAGMVHRGARSHRHPGSRRGRTRIPSADCRHDPRNPARQGTAARP